MHRAEGAATADDAVTVRRDAHLDVRRDQLRRAAAARQLAQLHRRRPVPAGGGRPQGVHRLIAVANDHLCRNSFRYYSWPLVDR